MAKRTFGATKIKRSSSWRQMILPVVMFAVIVGFFYWGMASINEAAAEERLSSVERAVRKAVVQCYAVEGQYPASYRYLSDHYGLMVDEETYIVQIDFAGGNIMPQITVIPRYF